MATHRPGTLITLKENSTGQHVCPDCGKDLWGMEYDYTMKNHYDGISEWFCPKDNGNGGCGLRVGRWSGKVLTGRQTEKPYGGK